MTFRKTGDYLAIEGPMAKVAAFALELTLMTTKQGNLLCGFPAYRQGEYFARLRERGYAAQVVANA